MAYQAEIKDPESMRDLIAPSQPVGAQPSQPDPNAPAPSNKELIDNQLSGAATVSPNQTVRSQLDDLLSGSSEYLDAARQAGLRTAADRGLINSSIAGQAGEAAAIGAAMPIATQDAATNAQAARQRQGFLETQSTTTLQGDINARLQKQNAQNTSELSKQQAGETSELSAQNAQQALVQLTTQGDITKALQTQAEAHDRLMADVNAGHAIDLSNLDFQHQLGSLAAQLQNSTALNSQQAQIWLQQQNQLHKDTLAQIDEQARVSGVANSQQVSASLQSQYLSSVSGLQATTSNEIAQIYQTQGLTPDQQANAVAEAMNRLTSNINALQAQYVSSPFWNPSWASQPPGGGPTGITGPGTMRPPEAPPPGSTTATSGGVPYAPVTPTQSAGLVPPSIMPTFNYTPQLQYDPNDPASFFALPGNNL
jgi:hypothetical protein